MSFDFLNRCIWTAVSTGLGDFVVSGPAQNGYIPSGCLDPAVTNGAAYHYFAVNGTEHEEGDGLFNTATSTLTRTTIRNSSTGGAKVNFSVAPVVTMGGPAALDMPSIGSQIVGGTPGSILFVDSGPDFAQDNAHLFWNASTKALAITGSNLTIDGDGTAFIFTAKLGGVDQFFVDDTGFGQFIGFGAIDATVAVDSAADTGTHAALALNQDGFVTWTSGVSWFTGQDVGLARVSAGLLEVNNGVTPGAVRDLNVRNLNASGVVHGQLISQVTYTSSQTITIPTGATRCIIEMDGNGGGSGSAATANANKAGGGGGSGGSLGKYLTGLTPGNTLVYTLGALGTAGASGGPNVGGNAGNNTLASGTQTISTLTVFGGAGSAGASSTVNIAGAAGGAVSTGGDWNSPGTRGVFGVPGTGGSGGGGGPAKITGRGADGIFVSTTTPLAGNAGLAGSLVIQWFA